MKHGAVGDILPGSRRGEITYIPLWVQRGYDEPARTGRFGATLVMLCLAVPSLLAWALLCFATVTP